jgi:hypothetical protein
VLRAALRELDQQTAPRPSTVSCVKPYRKGTPRS